MGNKRITPFADSKNYVFVGEAGCGKSELAINLSHSLNASGLDVHFFDLDQTKPLFRSRDLKNRIQDSGIHFHYEEQFYDAPTIAGGIARQLASENSRCVLDVGGNDTGSRVIGGFASLINQDNTTVYFVVNPFRPWSKNLESIIETLQSIMTASRLKTVRVICNPNLGHTTTAKEALEGIQRTVDMLANHISIDFVTAQENIAQELQKQTAYPVYPMQLYLRYPWTQN